MTFLNPIAGIVAALIAVPLLLLLYFLKLRRRPLRVSSTLLWEQAGADLQVNVPFRWLKFSFMLLLQFATLLALLVALARPALDLSTPTSKRVVLFIDHSASMNALDGPLDAATGRPISRLAQAQSKAKETALSLLRSRGGEVLIAQYSTRASVVQGFTSLEGDVTAAIDAITPTDQPADVRAAMALIEPLALQAERPDTPANAPATSDREPLTVLILSDGGPAINPAPVVASGLDVRLVRCGPEPRSANPASTPPTPAADLPVNRGIVALSVKRDTEDPATIRVFVRAISTSPRPETSLVRLALDGRDAASAALDFAPTPASRELLEASATLSVSSTAGGVVTVSLPTGDALACDDQASAVVTPLKRPRTILVREASQVGQKDVLTALLGEMDLASLRVVDPATLPPEALTGESADLLIFDRVSPPSQTALRTPSIILGADLPLSGDRALRLNLGDGSTSMRPVAWKRNHPVLRYVALDSLLASPTSWLAADTIKAGSPVEKIEALADGPRGPIIDLVELPPANTRHVVVGFDVARSNWQVDVSFLVFVANAIDFLTGKSDRDSGHFFTTSQEVTVTAVPHATSIVLTGPSARTVPIKPLSTTPGTANSSDRQVPLGLLDRTGLYRCEGAAPPNGALAINLMDESESSIATRDSINVISESGDRATAAPGTSDGGPREVWHWFVLAALILSTVEWLAFARTMRG